MNVSVGILGFGERARFLNLVAQLATEPSVVEVLLFWNGAPDHAREFSEQLAHRYGKLRFRISPENLGSAGGYSSLLRWFDDVGAGDFLWLLDDDAIPELECLGRLLGAAESPGFDPSRSLLAAYRADLPEFPRLLLSHGTTVELRPGVCVGLHLLNLILPPPTKPNQLSEHIHLSSAPYGGLLIPRTALSRLGLPDEELFLYGDDTVLTLRFTRSGGCIRLCQDAVVHDAEPVWNAIGGGAVSNMARRIVYLDDRKSYYETRNRCYLGLVFYPGHPMVYWMNRMTFLMGSLWLAIRHNRLARFRLIHRALRDGERMARQARQE